MAERKNDYNAGFQDGKGYGLYVGSISENKHILENLFTADKILHFEGVGLKTLHKIERDVFGGWKHMRSYYQKAQEILKRAEKRGVNIKPGIKALNQGYEEYLTVHARVTANLAWTIKKEEEK